MKKNTRNAIASVALVLSTTFGATYLYARETENLELVQLQGERNIDELSKQIDERDYQQALARKKQAEEIARLAEERQRREEQERQRQITQEQEDAQEQKAILVAQAEHQKQEQLALDAIRQKEAARIAAEKKAAQIAAEKKAARQAELARIATSKKRVRTSRAS